jgi:hypothetical protein
MRGEFHGMDSGEVVKVIIPECIQIPPGLSNTYLLSDSAYLLAGHQYVSHLSKPKLKFKGGGAYTMSVTREHKLITILPIRARVSEQIVRPHIGKSTYTTMNHTTLQPT